MKYPEIIKSICDELSIEHTVVSENYGIVMLKKGNKRQYITGVKFPNNDNAVGTILDFKFATFDVLKHYGIPVCEHKIFYGNHNDSDYAKGCNSYEDLVQYFKENDCKIVVKVTNGSCGNDVYKIENINELQAAYKNFSDTYAYVVSPFYDIVTEYRSIVVNGGIKLMYGKVRPIVVGDGIKTIRELLIEFNPNYFSIIDLSDEKYSNVLKQGQKFEYGWKFNLSQGATLERNIDGNIRKKISDIVTETASKLNIKFASIDTILTSDGKIRVLEINSGVMMSNFIEICEDGEVVARRIYKEAIKSMF